MLVAVSFKLKGTDTFVPWPESAGDYVVVFSVASTENYTGLTFTTEFSILPVSVHAPEKIADFDWNFT